MDFRVARSSGELANQAFELVRQQLGQKPDSVFVLPTGSTPMPLYDRLVLAHSEFGLDFSRAHFFNLDEYVGLASQYGFSNHFFLHHHLFSRINASKNRLHLFNPLCAEPNWECAKMESLLSDHPVDLAILGIGSNAHMAFNEPGSLFDSKTRVVSLSDSTRRANLHFFPSLEQVPKRAMTLGIGSILNSKKILLLASGTEKSLACHSAFDYPPSTRFPASVLQRHADATLVCDALAASRANFFRSPLSFGRFSVFHSENLPSKKRIVCLASGLNDATVSSGALLKALSKRNTVVSVFTQPLEAKRKNGLFESDPKVMESEALETAKVLGVRCILLKSRDSIKGTPLKSEEEKLVSVLEKFSPDIVVIPNDSHESAHDFFARRVGLRVVSHRKGSKLWTVETPNGLFAGNAANAVFEFGPDLLLVKLLALRKHASLLQSSRFDDAVRHLASFRRVVTEQNLEGGYAGFVKLLPFVELFRIEEVRSKKGKK